MSSPTRVRWNAHAVPYVESERDADAAYTLGLVHAHLRLAQLHMLKRIAQGRVAEMLGPLAVKLDHALRLLDLPGAARACDPVLGADTRAWLDPFVRGLNHYQQRIQKLPPEFRWLALQPEPWTLIDILTLGRLAGADVNWSSYLSLLRTRDQPGLDRRWQRLRMAGGTAAAGPVVRALAQLSRAGSNSVVIAASRSASGAPLMANDPHLGQTLPNFWMLVGLRCPSYHMVGLMPPGLPFVGVGSGPHFAWGGTNMRAASSDLVDVSSLDDRSIQTQETRIRVRGLGTRRRLIRRTPYGPILNDAAMLKVAGSAVALRWMGQRPSDEIGAFLNAARATTPEAFRAAFASFGVCAQNILFASRDGHIGHVYAAHLPRRGALPEHSPLLTPEQADAAWAQRWDAQSLPMSVNPDCGFRVSANDRPHFTDAPLGFFFSEGDRAARLAQLAGAGERIDLEMLVRLQNDTRVPGAARLAQSLAQRLDEAAQAPALAALLRAWNGDYAAEASAPPAFEALLHGLARGLAQERPAHWAPGHDTSLDDEWGRYTRLLLPDLDSLSMAARSALLRNAARQALATQRRFPTWGSQHRLRITHLLGAIPGLGRALQIADWPAGGTRESPMKNSHGAVRGRHAVQYGAQARHLADLSDLDAQHFVLLGGNDGWIGSANYADQLALWRERRYLRMPLRAQTVREEFPWVTELSAASLPSTPARELAGALPVPQAGA